jgi:hypothetical protein
MIPLLDTSWDISWLQCLVTKLLDRAASIILSQLNQTPEQRNLLFRYLGPSQGGWFPSGEGVDLENLRLRGIGNSMAH